MSSLTPQEILSLRADKLAAPIAESEKESRLSLLEFNLGQEKYAIDAAFVHSVVPTTYITPLPSVPPYILGILSVQGLIWSIMDLRIFFNIPRMGISDHPRAILVEAGGLRFGIMASSSLKIIHPESLSPPPEVTERIPRNVVRGTTKDLTVVLDIEVLAKDPRMTIQEDSD
ncbi:MAG: chemotaxis protein CheW [bacterium]|nr:chemotaxis protein CheW [bacterium]